MPLRTTVFGTFLVLAGCAAQPQPPVRKVLAPAPPPGLLGTILAMRPVPPASPQAVQVLLSGVDQQAAPSDSPRVEFSRFEFPLVKAPLVEAPLVEYIVRTASGTTIAVVQPETGNLHPGEHVSILSGIPPRIGVPAIPAAAPLVTH